MDDDPKAPKQELGEASPVRRNIEPHAADVDQGRGATPANDRSAAEPPASDLTPNRTGTARPDTPAPSEPSQVNLAGATVVEARTAPVDDKLPAIAKAGVELTKIVLGLIAGFLVLSFISLNVGESVAGNRARDDLRAINIPCTILTIPLRAAGDTGAAGPGADSSGGAASVNLRERDSSKTPDAKAQTCTIDAPILTAVVAHVEKEMSGFRTVWWQFVETVLINMLLPVLTALLGYVFGTRATAQKEEK